ncbi:MAG: type II toxin-antitoxin system RelE/ParE family toxin [Thermodesulfobacteriota bacterium]
MIRSFAHKGLKKFYLNGNKRYIQTKHTEILELLLDRLEAAADIWDMAYPGSGLHLLEPRSEGRWAVKVSGNWRVTFKFENGDAYEINYEDYH